MITSFPAALLFWYGLFLAVCGIISVIFIGMKAKTALVSGSVSGIMAVTSGHFIYQQAVWAPFAGILITLALSGVFAWRSTKALHALFNLIPQAHADLKSKGIAFLIISLMAVVSVMVTILQLVFITRL